MPSTTQPVVTIRPLRSHRELDAAVALQRDVWGYSDLDVDARAILIVASRFSGQTLGAFEQPDTLTGNPERLIGFSLAFASLPFGHLHSHRVGVHPSYQNLGIGRKLKLAQREDALSRGVEVIHWTFDPLQERNAYFNLERLGVIAKTYLPNLYGITTSPLHGSLPTDRLLAEWHLKSDRVMRALAGEKQACGTETREIRLSAPALRKDKHTQAALREQFLLDFSEGYTACGFRQDGGSHVYALERL